MHRIMERILLLTFAALCCIPTILSSCSNGDAVFTSNSKKGNSKFSFITQSVVNITLDYKCNSSYYLDYFWLKPWQNTTNGRHLWRIHHWYWWYSDRMDHGNDLNFQYDDDSDGFQLTTTILNVNSSHDNSEFFLKSRVLRFPLFKKIRLDIICCRATSIPYYLSLNNAWVGEDLNCLASGTATCKSGAMFTRGRTNEYRTEVEFQCNIYGYWDYQRVDCLPSCPRPPYLHLYIKTYPQHSKRYKSGYKLSLGCPVGKMHAAISPSHFFSDTAITCQVNETWTSTNVACWAGQVVDFSEENINLRTRPTIFTCHGRTVLEPRIVVGDLVMAGNERAWANVTMTPDYNGITAACMEIDSFNTSLYEKKTYLNIQFEAELTATVPSRFEFESGSRNHVSILFRANPTVRLSYIRATRNGSSITNFYLTINGTKHEAVLHFTRVAFSDGGDYEIFISSPPLASILSVNFTIDVISPAPRPNNATFGEPGDIAAAVLGVVLVLGVIGGIIAFSRVTKMKTGQNKVNNDTTVAYHAEAHPQYEDIEDPPVQNTQSKLDPAYVNTMIGRDTQNDYAGPMRPALMPNRPQRQTHPGNYRMGVDSFDNSYEDTVYAN